MSVVITPGRGVELLPAAFRYVWLSPGLSPTVRIPEHHHLSNLLETKDSRQFKKHGPNISKRIMVIYQICPKNASV